MKFDFPVTTGKPKSAEYCDWSCLVDVRRYAEPKWRQRAAAIADFPNPTGASRMTYFFDWESVASTWARTSSCDGRGVRNGKLSSSFRFGALRPRASPQLAQVTADVPILDLTLEPHEGQNFNEQASSTGRWYKLQTPSPFDVEDRGPGR